MASGEQPETSPTTDELHGHPDLFPPESIQAVVLSGVVLMQIAKHASDLASVPNSVASGMLLGLDANDNLDVTYSHPLPTSATLESAEDGDFTAKQFQVDMLSQLRATGVQANYCGWYRAASLDDLAASASWASIVSYQADFQKDLPNSVVLLYDHSKAVKGLLSVRAFRLSAEFMGMYTQVLNSPQARRSEDGNPILSKAKFFENKISSSDIFEEIPIKIQNPLLLHAQLYELRKDKLLSENIDRLDLSSASILRKNLRRMEETIDEYVSEQSQYLFYQKKVQRLAQERENYLAQRRNAGDPVNPEELARHPAFRDPPPPSRLNSFLIANQLRESSDQVTDLANLGFAKLYALQALTKSK